MCETAVITTTLRVPHSYDRKINSKPRIGEKSGTEIAREFFTLIPNRLMTIFFELRLGCVILLASDWSAPYTKGRGVLMFVLVTAKDCLF